MAKTFSISNFYGSANPSLDPNISKLENIPKNYYGRSGKDEFLYRSPTGTLKDLLKGRRLGGSFENMRDTDKASKNRNFSALNLPPLQKQNIINQSYTKNNLPIPNSGYSSLAPSNQQMMEMANVRGQTSQGNVRQDGTPPNLKNNLLNYIASPHGKGMAQGLLEASGYSEVPVTFGQALAMGMKRGNEYQAAADTKQIKSDEFEYIKSQDLIKNLLSQQGLDIEARKLLIPQLGNFSKELLAVGINPNSPEGRDLLMKKLTSATTKIEMSSGEADKEKLKYSLNKLKEENKIVNAGRELDGRLQVMETLLKDNEFTTGFFEGYKMPFAQAFNALGILDDNEVEKIQKLEFFEAAASYMIPRMRAIGSGATSDFEIKLYKKAAPNIKNTKAGNQFIVAGMRAMHKFNDKKFQEMEKWIFENDSIQGFEAYYKKEFGNSIFKNASTDEEFNAMVADGKIVEGDLFLNKKTNKFKVITAEDLL